MDTNFIIINATGRSGSTTLQEIISTLPKSHICGEHNIIFTPILNLYEQIKHFHIKQKKHKWNDLEHFVNIKLKLCSYMPYYFETQVNHIRKFIIDLFDKENCDVLGCKNVNMTNSELKLFKELFPNTKFIMHIRNNVNEQIKSTSCSYCQYSEHSKNFVLQKNKELTSFYEENTDCTYLSTFEDLFDFNKMTNLFNFLGYEPDKDKITKILNSYTPYSSG